MSEVSCRAVGPILEALKKRRLALDGYLAVLELTEREAHDPTRRIPWDRFTRFLELLVDDLGGRPALAGLAGEIRTPDVARAITTDTMSVPSIYILGAKWLGPALFTNTAATNETLAGGRVRQEVCVADGYRDSPEFFWLMLGFLRSAPRILGLGEAQVEMQLAERRATYLIKLPQLVRSRAWLRRLLSRRDWLSGAIVELNVQRSQLEERYRNLSQANARVAAQSRDLALLVELGHEITRHTNISELAQAVVQLLGERFQLAGAALWANALEAGRMDEVGRLGETGDPPTRSSVLRSGGRVVGRLDVWLRAGEPGEELLDRLMPWIALAVDNALAFRALCDRTRLLQEEMTERRRAERQLVQAQKLEAVGALAGGLAHDFNNILTAIRVYTGLAAQRLAADHPARADLAEISVAGDRVAALTTQLLAFSRRPLVHPEIVDLNSVLARMEPMLSRLMREGSTLELCPASEALYVEIDPGQLEQVIVNLVHNARDALASVGGVARVVVQRADDCIELCVDDTGAGMDSATLSRAFEPFFTTKPPGQGTGLGLTAAYRIVTELGGRIEMESARGKGTKVRVEFPPCEGRAAEAAVEPPLRLTGKETVLVVDADEEWLQLTRSTLEAQGYTVLVAKDAEQTLAVCAEYSSAVQVVIVGLGRGDMSGPELVSRVRESRRELSAVIYLASDAAHLSGISGALPPGERLVRKPFAPNTLLLCVRNAIAETTTR